MLQSGIVNLRGIVDLGKSWNLPSFFKGSYDIFCDVASDSPSPCKRGEGRKISDVSTSFVYSSTVSNKVIPVGTDNGSFYRIILKSESNMSLESYKRTLFTSGGNVAKIVQRHCIFLMSYMNTGL